MNSYATITEANAYLSGLLGTEAWEKAGEPDKERALLTATIRIDSLEYVSGGFRGHRTVPGQPLAFPRAPDTEIPEAVKQACALEAVALLEASSDAAGKRRERAIQQGVVSATIGDASETYVDQSKLASGITGRLRSDMALSLLRPYLASRGVYQIR